MSRKHENCSPVFRIRAGVSKITVSMGFLFHNFNQNVLREAKMYIEIFFLKNIMETERKILQRGKGFSSFLKDQKYARQKNLRKVGIF